MVVSTKVWEEKVVTIPQIFMPSNFKLCLELEGTNISNITNFKWGSIWENPIMGLFTLLLIKDLLLIKLAYFSMSWNG